MNTKLSTLIWHILLIALIYAVTGRIGQLIGIPPGNVTLVWLPSGIALIALLYLGNYSLLGIWLGAFVANTWAFWDPSSVQEMFKAIAVGSMIGLGSVLQPVLGKRLLLQPKEHPSKLLSSRKQIYRFLAVVPVICLVSSTIGTLSLCLGGFAQWMAFWSIWQTWWLGDSIGILLIVFVATYWVVELSRVSYKEKLILLFPIILIITVTLLVFFPIKNNELAAIQSQFEAKAKENVTAFERGLKENTKHINALGGLISVIGNTITLEQFQTYSREITEHTPSIQAMEWVPIIPHDQRSIFEEKATKQWEQIFEIKEIQNNEMVTATTRDTYTPVYLVEPLEGNEKALGYDISSNPDRLYILDRAIRLNQRLLSPPIVLVQETSQSYGFLYVVPVTISQAVRDARQAVSGVALGVFRVETLASNLGEGKGQQAIHLRITDRSLASQQETIIYEHLSGIGGWTEQPSLFEYRETIDVDGRQWMFHFRAGEAFIPPGSFILPKVVLVVGHIFSALLTLLLIIMRGRLEADRKYRDELIAARETAEAANRTKSLFLASMSHELRTPLNAILGFSEMLEHAPNTTAEDKKKVAIINRSGAHLLSMINDVLNLSNIEIGKLELKLEAFDLPLMLRDISRMFEQRAANAKLRYILDLDPALAHYIKSDIGKLRQILIMLLGNAMRFTGEGGFSLRVRTLPIANNPAMCSLQVEVEDSGPGIAPEQRQQIFKPFVKADSAQSRSKGSGLGLTICKAFVDLMGGKISVDSEIGKGSLFRVVLPVMLAKVEETIDIETDKSMVLRLEPGQPSWRILVVEDSVENRLLLTTLLVQVGFEVQEAENGEEAVILFKEWLPHFIWMDMRMPVMDGYEATAKIRQLPGGDTVKIVAITASVFKEQKIHILEVGCDEVMHKPFKAHEVLNAMAEQLGVRYLYQESTRPVEAMVTLTAEMLAELPTDLKEALRNQAILLDLAATNELIERIRSDYPEMASGLQQLADSFRFEQILALLNDVSKRDA